jgi:hypothetical protein
MNSSTRVNHALVGLCFIICSFLMVPRLASAECPEVTNDCYTYTEIARQTAPLPDGSPVALQNTNTEKWFRVTFLKTTTGVLDIDLGSVTEDDFTAVVTGSTSVQDINIITIPGQTTAVWVQVLLNPFCDITNGTLTLDISPTFSVTNNAQPSYPAVSAQFFGSPSPFSIQPTLTAKVTTVSTPNPDGTYTSPSLIPIKVSLCRKIVIPAGTTGSLTLETGTTDAVAPLASAPTQVYGAPTHELVFDYLVGSSDISTDLDARDVGAMIFAEPLIDPSGNTVVTTLPIPGQTGSLSQAHAIVINPETVTPPPSDETPKDTSTSGGGSGTTTWYPNPPPFETNLPVPASIPPTITCPAITGYYKIGDMSDDVENIQKILNTYEEASLIETGAYDVATARAISAFQLKYSEFILKPWDITEPTGYFYLTTSRFMNYMMGCTSEPITLPNGNVIYVYGNAPQPYILNKEFSLLP